MMEISDINPDLMVELQRLKAEHKRDQEIQAQALLALSILIIDKKEKVAKEKEY